MKRRFSLHFICPVPASSWSLFENLLKRTRFGLGKSASTLCNIVGPFCKKIQLPCIWCSLCTCSTKKIEYPHRLPARRIRSRPAFPPWSRRARTSIPAGASKVRWLNGIASCISEFKVKSVHNVDVEYRVFLALPVCCDNLQNMQATGLRRRVSTSRPQETIRRRLLRARPSFTTCSSSSRTSLPSRLYIELKINTSFRTDSRSELLRENFIVTSHASSFCPCEYFHQHQY